MSPSALTETVQQVGDDTLPKTIPVKDDAKPANGHSAKNSAQLDLPELKTGHKEPLKLSGALDHFDSFDVTPVIGREFPHADLAKWLRSNNSDDLLRDLAITSKASWYYF